MPFVMQRFIAPNRVRHYETFLKQLHLYSLTNFLAKKNVGHLPKIHELLSGFKIETETKYLTNTSIVEPQFGALRG